MTSVPVIPFECHQHTHRGREEVIYGNECQWSVVCAVDAVIVDPNVVYGNGSRQYENIRVIGDMVNMIVNSFVSFKACVLLLECSMRLLQTVGWSDRITPKFQETCEFDSGARLASQMSIPWTNWGIFVVRFSPAKGTSHPSDAGSMEAEQ